MEPRAAVLKASFDVAHMVFHAVTADLTEPVAAYRPPGGTVPAGLSLMAHALFGEDMMVNQQARGEQMVLESAGLTQATGIVNPSPEMTPEWLDSDFKLEGLKEYATVVFAATSAFLESATAEQLDRKVSHPAGERTAAEYLAGFGVVHLAEHTGELSALKGAQGEKGLPF